MLELPSPLETISQSPEANGWGGCVPCMAAAELGEAGTSDRCTEVDVNTASGVPSAQQVAGRGEGKAAHAH